MPTDKSITKIAENYADRIWNQKDLTAIEEFLHKDIMIHSLLGEYRGQNHMEGVVDAWLKAFPDLMITNTASITENDKVVLQWTAQGTHKGDFKRIQPTNKKVSYAGATIYRIKENKVVEYWAYLDIHHILEQIK